ncbi:MAG TPA: asparagine synthase (glutamine-hydrolyzing) [Longimicrobiales bacterium]|nr:asparagine synthase (glutamine-hydrolyzing) [Longimicrobiales bacterium]
MCGIAGFLTADALSMSEAAAAAAAMGSCLRHRGPDDNGIWVDECAGIALSHQRLSILDLSEAGHQPMVSRGGRYVIVFNGECYNHNEIRRDLARDVWRGHSDTETLLASFEQHGFEPTLQKMVGMFALALWDRHERTLTLARDRMGEKPLFYGWHGRSLLFGSELKSLRAHPHFRNSVDRSVVATFLRHGYVPAPLCIYEATRKLLPGTYIRFSRTDSPGHFPEPIEYWSLRNLAARSNPFRGTMRDAVDELERRLAHSIALQRVADVPLGAFLSGGIDSSTVVALMQAQSSAPVRTFTIGFHEGAFDEAPHARAVAKHLGTDHTELYVTSQQALEVIPRLPYLYDEPFGDASAVPTHLVSELARQHVTVSLSGDGGDELFFGYGRYLRIAELYRRLQKVPRSVRHLAAHVLRGYSVVDALGAAAPKQLRLPQLERKVKRAAHILQSDSVPQLYRVLVSHWDDPAALVLGAAESSTPFTSPRTAMCIAAAGIGAERALMYLDQCTILPEDILTKVDRAAMSVSLETRVPFLDHRIVEFAQTLPVPFLYDGVRGKLVLRELLSRYVPPSLYERPKQGFGVPIGSWMRGPLRDWAEDLLAPSRIRDEGIFDERVLTRKWNEYLHAGAAWEYQLWDVLMFQAWYRASISPVTGAAA